MKLSDAIRRMTSAKGANVSQVGSAAVLGQMARIRATVM